MHRQASCCTAILFVVIGIRSFAADAPKTDPPKGSPATQPSDKKDAAKKKDEPDWQSIYAANGELALKTKAANFTPRTKQFRITLLSERIELTGAKRHEDLSSITLSVWIEDRDPQGHKEMRPLDVKFKKRGGNGYQNVFDIGLWPDGTPRAFQADVSGNYVKYDLKIEDLGSGTVDQAKGDNGKKKK